MAYSVEFMGEVFTLMGAVAIYLSTLSLIILALSLWGIKSFRGLGYMGLFLLCMGVASVVYFAYVKKYRVRPGPYL
jgi:hypothetical protein